MNNGLPDIEIIIRDLGIVAETYGNPLYNSAFVLFAGKQREAQSNTWRASRLSNRLS